MLWFLLHFIQVGKKKKEEAIMNQNFERAERTTFDISTKTEDQEKDGGGRKLKD